MAVYDNRGETQAEERLQHRQEEEEVTGDLQVARDFAGGRL